jgi:hypothetical protein
MIPNTVEGLLCWWMVVCVEACYFIIITVVGDTDKIKVSIQLWILYSEKTNYKL